MRCFTATRLLACARFAVPLSYRFLHTTTVPAFCWPPPPYFHLLRISPPLPTTTCLGSAAAPAATTYLPACLPPPPPCLPVHLACSPHYHHHLRINMGLPGWTPGRFSSFLDCPPNALRIGLAGVGLLPACHCLPLASLPCLLPPPWLLGCSVAVLCLCRFLYQDFIPLGVLGAAVPTTTPATTLQFLPATTTCPPPAVWVDAVSVTFFTLAMPC